MKNQWGNDSCETIQACYSVCPVSVTAVLWRGVSADDLESRIRAIYAAIDSGKLQACREDGRKITEHVAYERRHVYGLDLKESVTD